MDRPFVSALTPTCNRREFFPRAVSCFLSQDYPNLEWIILDDGAEPIRDLIPPDPRIKYFYEQPKRMHGYKMNRCFELSSGEFGIVWDDDDWYPPSRITRQIQPMLDNPSIQVVGTSTIYYYRHGTQEAWCYTNPAGVNWLASIAVRRSTWESHLWFDIHAGADYNFQRALDASVLLDLNDPTLVVSSVHPNNACRKTLGREYAQQPWALIQQVTGGRL